MADYIPQHLARLRRLGLEPNRPVYDPGGELTVFDSYVQACMLGAGAYVLSLSDLEHLHQRLQSTEDYLTNIEAFEVLDNDNSRLNLAFSIIGLDGEDGWAASERPAKFRALTGRLINDMKSTGTQFYFYVWI